jgi:acyl-CoA thioester hydrolase
MPEPPASPNEYAFRHPIRVRFSETDAMGIVHHSRYLPYLEEARVAYLRHIGHPYVDSREDGVDYAVLEAHVTYQRPLTFDEVVDVHLLVSSISRASFSMSYLLTVDGEVRSTARTMHACVDSAGRPVRLPEWLRAMAPPATRRPE